MTMTTSAARSARGRVLAIACCALLLGLAAGGARAELKIDRITVEYVAPADPQHRQVYGLLRERRVLERFQHFLSFIRLPRPLLLRTAGCDGESNAWYESSDPSVTVCYEYLYDLVRRAPKETTAGGVTTQDAIVGPTVEVFLHEVGHALFDMLKLPLLGREEDAADQVAAYILVSLGDDFARRTVAGVAHMYARDAGQATVKQSSFANVHSLDWQRLYNLLCIAYGSNTRLFGDVVEKKYLPQNRAETCEEEFRQVAYALQTLLAPYIDKDRAREVKAQRWLDPVGGWKR
jgi:hypothetical protein